MPLLLKGKLIKLKLFLLMPVEQVARREMRMMLLLPLLPLLALPYTTCSEGSPLWLYAIYVPFLLRSKYVELELMQALPAEFPDQAESALPWGFWLWLDFLVFGPLEHLDFFTDGAAPIQADLKTRNPLMELKSL